jgi:hypothetical protein
MASAENEDGSVLVDGFYLFEPERFSMPFYVLSEKLRQLNDYCFNQLISSESKLLELTDQRTAAMARKDSWAEEFDYLDDQIPMWEDNVAVIGKAVPVVLLCSFVEWGVKFLTKEFCGSIPRKTIRGLSDVEFLLRYLEQNSQLRLGVTSDLMLPINSFRAVRNSFAHGQWESVATQLSAISLRASFQAVSALFERIEEAAWLSPWGEITP